MSFHVRGGLYMWKLESIYKDLEATNGPNEVNVEIIGCVLTTIIKVENNVKYGIFGRNSDSFQIH